MTESKIIQLIKDILESESLKEKYKIINKDVFLIISNIIDKNPEFFILIEEVLLELVKDNKINLTIFNYSYFIEKLNKLFKIFTEIKLDEINNLSNINNFSDLIKITSIIIFESNKKDSTELLNKFNNLINNFVDFINIIKNV